MLVLIASGLVTLVALIAALIWVAKGSGKKEQQVRDAEAKDKAIDAAVEERNKVVRMRDTDVADRLRSWERD